MRLSQFVRHAEDVLGKPARQTEPVKTEYTAASVAIIYAPCSG